MQEIVVVELRPQETPTDLNFLAAVSLAGTVIFLGIAGLQHAARRFRD